MSLGGRDRQALDAIAGRLAMSDPRLAGLMATFARLASGEEMPAREKITAARRRWHERLGIRPAALLWLATAVVLIMVGLVASSGSSQGTCTTWFPATCTGQAFAHSVGAADHLP